ncbi:hypothetical protein [Pararobbsia silviterrae]|nr:hypothetical protein [Pararobbsia silviterrae]
MRVHTFQIVNRLQLRPTLLGPRLVRPSEMRRARRAGIPCALGRAAAAFDALSPRIAHSVRRRQAQARARVRATQGTPRRWIDKLSSAATWAVTIRRDASASRTFDRDLRALDASNHAGRPPVYPNARAGTGHTGVQYDASRNIYASMDVIEAYVDTVRKAQGKPTYADLDPNDADFEAQLDDFVADVFRAMGASPPA